jgi:Spy/CpxP family protein refolding chaperone
MLRRLLSVLLLALSLAFVTNSAFAQPNEDKRAKVEARRKELIDRILRREVGLDEKKADAVEKLLVKHQAERKRLQKEQREQRQTIKKLLADKSEDEDAYKKAVDGFRATQKKLQGVRESELDDLAKILTPREQAKLFAALQRLKKKLARRGPNDRSPND